MKATLTLVYERQSIITPGGVLSRHSIIREFDGSDVTMPEMLDAFEDLLRSAGFYCPHESLDIVVDESESGSSS